MKSKELLELNSVQQASGTLIQRDLRFLYTMMKHTDSIKYNYPVSLLPYLGIIINGAEKWVKAVNSTRRNKLPIPLFSADEQQFYEEIRNSIKLWQQDYNITYEIMKDEYHKSEQYFGGRYGLIAKMMKWYDFYGIDTIDGVICGNTVLNMYYTPFYNYDTIDGEYLKAMGKIGGSYIKLFDAKKEYAVDDSLVFDSRDYGGLIKSPVGNGFSDKFVLLSILGQINFLIYGVDKWIKEDIPAKLRFAYLLYFYLLKVIPQINIKLNTHFTLEEKWCDGGFRNAMAHYKLVVVLRKEDIFYEDIMFGLTCHFFNEGYTVVKESIYSMLEELAIQIGCYLNLQKGFISTKL